MRTRAFNAFQLLVAVLFLASPVYAQKTVAPPVPGFPVRGRVRYNDTNNPVRRAFVKLVGVEGSADQPGTTTSRKGEFSFANVPAGRYLAIVEAGDLISPYVVSSYNLWEEWLLGEIEFGCAEVIVGAAGTAPVTIVAQRGGAITGRITDSEGMPVADAEVSVYRRWDDEADRDEIELSSDYRASGRPVSDDRGIYRIAGLPEGKYVVRVNDSDLRLPGRSSDLSTYVTGKFVAIYYPEMRTPDEAKPVEVVAGRDTAEINIRMPDQQTHNVSGTIVFGPTSLPLSDVKFRVYRKGEEPAPTDYFSTSSMIYGEKGAWSAKDLPDGVYVIAVDTNGQPKQTLLNGERSQVNVLPAQLEFVVNGADLNGLTVSLDEAAVIAGKVTFTGPKQDHSRLRLEAIPARVFEEGISYYDDEWKSTIAWIDDDDTFKFDQLVEGSYYLRLEGDDQFAFSAVRVTVDGRDFTGKPISVSPSKPVSGLGITIAAALTQVKATAAAGDKQPVGDVLFFIRPADELEWRRMDDPIHYRGDRDGRISIRLQAGEYLIAATRRRPGKSLEIDDDFWEKNSGRLQHLKIAATDKIKDLAVTLEAEP